MHFFSRYSYIWRFPGAQEEVYARFVMPGNLTSLRLVAFITLFGMSLFLAIDFFRDVEYSTVFLTRSFALLVATALMALSFRKSLSIRAIYLSVSLLAFTNFGVAIVTATFARMPSFYLTNLLFLILVLVITASGLNFRHAFFLNSFCMVIFVVYSQFIRVDPFYTSQYPHLFSIFLYIHIVGLVLESRRRLNFLQFSDLEAQKRLVEELNQQKNKIISILSHDVASPLNSLSGLLNLQAKGYMKPDELAPFLIDLNTRVEGASMLLQNLVRWSKSQMEGFVPAKGIVSLNDIILETVRLFTAQTNEKAIQVTFNNAHELQCLGDKDMVTIAFRNLFSNAIKYSSAGQRVVIELIKTFDTVSVRIANEGATIPQEIKSKLFSFDIQSVEGTAGESGTGLGLAMSAYFVGLNKGRIFLDESRNGWITFCIELPAPSV